MGCLFIAGNGFDVAHGIPTKYSDIFKKLSLITMKDNGRPPKILCMSE